MKTRTEYRMLLRDSLARVTPSGAYYIKAQFQSVEENILVTSNRVQFPVGRTGTIHKLTGRRASFLVPNSRNLRSCALPGRVDQGRSRGIHLACRQTVCEPHFVFFTNPINRFLSIFNTTPEFRSATSLTLYSAAVPSTWAVSEGVSL